MGRAVRSIAAAVAVLSSFAACEDAVTSVEGPTVGEIVGYVEAYDTTFATVGSKVDTTEHRHPLANVGVLVYAEQDVVHGTADEYMLVMSDSPLASVEIGDKTLGHDTGVGFVKFRARLCRGPCPHPGGSLPSSSM